MRRFDSPFFDKWLHSSLEGLGDHHQELERKWNDKHIWTAAPDIKRMLHGFKYIIEVDWMKLLEGNKKFGWIPSKEFRDKYYYPNRELGDHVVVIHERGEFVEEGIFEFNEFGGDACFVATNNDFDALMIALKYS